MGSPGAISAVLGFGRTWFGFESIEKSVYLGVSFFVSWGLLRFIFFYAKVAYNFLVLKHSENSYGNILKTVVASNAYLNLAKRETSINDVKFKQELTRVCEEYKSIFDLKTRSTCSVSIKVLKHATLSDSPLSSDAEMVCMARDSGGVKNRHTQAYLEGNHRIHNNTCYNVILNNLTSNRRDRLFYINNCISPKRDEMADRVGKSTTNDYFNTSYEYYDSLPYRSEIVVPIIPLTPAKDGRYKLLGFICVDSSSKASFDGNYDVSILRGLADDIFDLFALYLKSQPSKSSIV